MTDGLVKYSGPGCSFFLRNPDGTVVTPKIGARYAFSGMNARVSGPDRLVLEDGVAKGDFAVKIWSRYGFGQGVKFVVYWNYPLDPQVMDVVVESSATVTRSYTHEFREAGTYSVVVLTQKWDAETDSEEDAAISNCLRVKVTEEEDGDASPCGVVCDWSESDARAVLSPMEDWGVLEKTEDRDFCVLNVKGYRTPAGGNEWWLNADVYSFADAASAQSKFDEVRKRSIEAHPQPLIIDDSSELFSIVYLAWTQKGQDEDNTDNFRLMKLYRDTFVIYVNGSSTLPGDSNRIPVEDARTEFLGIVENAQGVVDGKCGF
jgi:hypothetical protein